MVKVKFTLDRQTDRRTDGQTDRPTDRQGDSYIPPKLRLRGYKKCYTQVVCIMFPPNELLEALYLHFDILFSF